MKIQQLREKQAIFQATFKSVIVKDIRIRLELFCRDYPIISIDKLKLSDYVYGRYQIDGKKTFCYWMEKELDDFGLIAGSPCFQYGVWYGTRGKDKDVKYRHTKRYGNSLEDALREITKLINDLYKMGEAGDYEGIARNMIADKFKGKLLASYFPDTYLSIYADFYLNDILRYFNLDEGASYKEAAIFKQLRLLKWKAEDEVMKHWDLPKFAIFINEEMYHHFYPPRNGKKEEDNFVPKFSELSKLSISFDMFDIDVDGKGKDRSLPKKHSRTKPDYLKKSIRDLAVGNRGEQIVKEFEQRKLQKVPSLGEKIRWISEKTDGQGYDIDSFELDGTPMQIEVKSTTRVFNGQAVFFLTEFERLVAIDLPNHYVYYVSEVGGEVPKIWAIKAPFHRAQEGVALTPTSYCVEISRKK